MKLYFSDPTSRPAINIHRLNRLTFNIRDIILSIPSEIESLIVLGDGTPEDEIAGILVTHQKADKIVGIVKPDKHGIDSFNTTKDYFERLKVRCLLFIIDQDDAKTMDDLFGKIESVIRQQGIETISSKFPDGTDQAKVYDCMLAGEEFRVIAVISGLPTFEAPVHEIEDHFLKLAGINAADDAKRAWNNLQKDKKDAVLISLKDKKTVEAAFPQHFIAFSLL